MGSGITRANLGPAARLFYDRQKEAQAAAQKFMRSAALPSANAIRTRKGIRDSERDALEFLNICDKAGLPRPELEFVFHPVRKWRFDVAFVRHKIAIEIQGGAYIAGRHNRGVSFVKEMEKANSAAIIGWRILYRTPSEFLTFETAELVQRAMRGGRL